MGSSVERFLTATGTTGREQLKPRSVVDDFLERTDAEEVSRLQLATQHGDPSAADRSARVLEMQERTQLSPDLIDRNFEEVERQLRVSAFDPAVFRRESPAVAAWIAEHPTHASVAGDDLPQLSKLEKIFIGLAGPSRMGAAFTAVMGRRAGAAESEMGRIGFEAIRRGPLDDAQRKRLEELERQIGRGAEGRDFFDRVLYGGAKIYGQMAESAPLAIGAALVGAGTGAAAGALGGPVGAAAGGLFGLVSGFATYAYQVEAGHSYLAVDQIRDENGVGIPEDEKRSIALGVGFVNGLLETVGAGTIAAPFKTVARQFMRESVKDALARPTMRAALNDLGRSYVTAIAGETGTEVLQEMNNILAEEFATWSESDQFNVLLDDPEEREGAIWRLAAIARETAEGMMLVGAPGAAIHGGTSAYHARKAEQREQFYLALGETVAESKTFQRLPRAVQTIVEHATKDGPISTVYAPVETFTEYFQSKKIDPAAVAEELGVRESFEEATQTGSDIAIPIATYATKIAPTEHNAYFAKELRRRPNEMNAREAQAFVEAETQRSVTTEAAPAEDQAKAIGDQIFQQLVATGTKGYDESAARTLSTALFEGVYRNLATRTGISAQELYRRKPVRIVGQPLASDAPAGPRINFEELANRALAMREERAEREGMEAEEKPTSPYGVESLARDLEARTETGEYVYARRPSGSLRSNLSRVSVDGMIDELVMLFEAQNRDQNVATPTLVPDENFHTFNDGRAWVGMKGAAINASGRIARRKLSIDKVEAELARRGVTDADARFVARMTGQSLEPEFTAFQSAIPRYLALAKAADDPKNSAKVRAEARRRAMELEPIARTEHDERIVQATREFEERTGERWLYQPSTGDEGNRGSIRIGENSIDIRLLADADLSTFIHETAHFYVELLRDLASEADMAEQIKRDWGILRDFVGAKEGEQFTLEQHEKVAQAFERYVMEGKAPSTELRGAFARFRAWLIDVYRRIENLHAFLSDEVRGVFDRLVATDDAINAAQQEQATDGLSEALRAAGVPEPALTKIVDAEADVRFAAEEYLTSKLIADVQREQSAIYQARRAEIRAEVAEEVNEERDYVALAFLSKGTKPDGSFLPAEMTPFKLSKSALENEYASRYPNLLKRFRFPHFLYAKEHGEHPDTAASLLGFRSGDDLIRTLLSLPENGRQRIDRITEERLRAEWPELLSASELPIEAMKAIHNEKRAQLHQKVLELLASDDLATLKGLVRRVSNRIAPVADVRAEAERMTARRLVKEINPLLYQRAEQKAAKAALDALLAGDIQTAFEEKQRERLNHELYRAATEAESVIEKVKEEVRDLFKSDEKLADRRDMDLVNAARAIAASYGLGKIDELGPDDFLEAIRRYDEDTYETLKEMVDRAKSRGPKIEDSTFADVVAMREAIQALWDLSLRNRQIEIDGQRMDAREVREQLEGQIRYLGQPFARLGYNRAVSDSEKSKLNLIGARAALRRVESWVDAMDSGNSAGPFRRFVWNPISEATATYRDSKNQYLKRYLDIVRGVEQSLSVTPIEAPEIEYTFKGKAELLGAILHTGNESNRDKLTRGRGWDPDAWRQFVNRMQRDGVLTKADYDYAQAVWDLFEAMKPDAQRAHRAMYGRYFDEITAHPVFTPWGEYRGGYVPARVDPDIVTDAAIRAEKEALEQGGNSAWFPSTGRGFTKTRVNEYARPLLLDLRFVPAHIDAVMRFTHIQPRVKDVARLVMHREFRAVLDAFDPAAGGDMLVPWLQRAASQRIETPATGRAARAAATFARALRRNTGLGIMAANVTNALQQLTGFSMAAVKVKPRYLRNALWTYVRSPSTVAADISEKSEFMRTRVTTQVMEVQSTIDDLLLNPTKYEQAREFARKHGYFLQQGTQNVVDLVVWAGGYEQAIESGANERDAVRQADSAVRLTQGSFSPEDVSRFESGGAVARLFSIFYSYFNMQANLLGTEFSNTVREMGLKKGAGRLLYVYTLGFAIPAILSELIVRGMSGDWADDDDAYLDDVLAIFFGSQLRTATTFVPFAGPAVQTGLNFFNDRWYDDRISLSPAISTIESAMRAPHSVYKAITDDGSRKKAARDLLTALTLLTGIPFTVAGRPAGYLLELEQEGEEPENAIDAVRGLVTGRAGYQ